MRFSRGRSGIQIDSRLDTVSVKPENPDFVQVAATAHTRTRTHIVRDLGSSEDNGLTKNEATRRLMTYGENLLQGESKVSAIKVLVSQIGVCLLSSRSGIELTRSLKRMH